MSLWNRGVLLLLGVGSIIAGWHEGAIAWGSRAEPTDVDLTALEAGQVPPQAHVRIGPHVRLYPATVYSSKKANEPKQDKDRRIEHCVFPIVSGMRQAEPGGDQGKDPGEGLPDVASIRVFVKSRMFASASAIPDRPVAESAVVGVILRGLGTLHEDEVRLIREQFPHLNPDRLLLLDAGRTPWAGWLIATMLVVGVLLCLPAVWWVIGLFPRRRA